MSGSICGGSIAHRRRVLRCPKCRVRRRVVESFHGGWYGCSWACVTCGATWADGEWRPLGMHAGFEKDDHLDRVAEEWRNALTPEEYEAAMREDVEASLP